MRRRELVIGVFSLVLFGWMAGVSLAALTAEQKKELKEIGTEIGKIAALVSKKKYDDAAAAIQSAEERITEFIKNADIKETDPVLKVVHAQLEKVRNQLAKASGRGTVSFEKTIAPVIAGKCVSCHGEDQPKGNLSLETFEGLEKGGRSGDIVVPGNPEGSLLLQRLVTEDENLRMPKGKEALSEKEIKAIYTWINEGAKFNGEKTAAMSTLSKSAGKPKAGFGGAPSAPPPKKPEINKETGKETVHFTKDIMPELVDTCGRCHNDTPQRRAGFSVLSFENLMKGGDSGVVIVGGSLEKSRLWRLLNGPDEKTPIMPAGNQTGITRPWYEKMKTWILEGAKFDGTDASKKFPTFEEREAMARAGFTPDQWLTLRKKEADAEWKKTFPTAEPILRETPELLLYGDVNAERLEQIDKWAGEHIASLRQTFKVKEEPLWKGKLAVFVFKERFGYEEFNNSVHRRQVPAEVIGNVSVKSDMTQASVALQDVGDAATESSPGMHVNVIEQLTGAYLKRGSGNLPDWLIRGTGLALANHKLSGNPFIATMPRLAGAILQKANLGGPEEIFGDGAFSPAEVGPVGFTLVEYLLKRGNMPQFGQFVQKLQSGAKAEAAIKEVYQVDGKTMAVQYASSLPSGGLKKGKK